MITNPHDRLFKGTFSRRENAAEILRSILPPGLVQHLDFGTLAPKPDTFVDEHLGARFSDLLFTIALAGRQVFLYLLFEHQSTPDPLMPFRLLRYMVFIWTKHLDGHKDATRLPVIIPVVLHHGEDGWRAPTWLGELYDLPLELQDVAGLQALLPDFTFLLDDLAHQSDEELRKRALSALSTLVLWTIKNARRHEDMTEAMEGAGDLMARVLQAPNGIAALTMVMRYILEVTETPTERMQAFLASALDSQTSEAVMTTAEKLRQEGWTKGHGEGLKTGRKEGLKTGRKEGLKAGRKATLRATLLKLLGRRFGALPAPVTRRIRRADSAQLDRWTERVLTAQTLDEVFTDEMP